MNRTVNVHLLPELADPHDLAGHCSVVIDVLRASTTITTAVAAGVKSIVPCLTVEEARQLSAQRRGSLLGGERKGKPLPGFDLGNSPAEYTPARVADRSLVFTTTNGTRAMARCIGSSTVLIGSLVNRAALCKAVATAERIDLICAGTDGEVSLDDALGAGAIVAGLKNDAQSRLNDAARLCQWLWDNCQQARGEDGAGRILDTLRQSIGGRNLIHIGMDEDIRFAADLDRLDTVPVLDRSSWEIRQQA